MYLFVILRPGLDPYPGVVPPLSLGEKHIDFALTSPFGGGAPGRVKKKKLAAKGGGEDDE